jgi:hypothetical protein
MPLKISLQQRDAVLLMSITALPGGIIFFQNQ